MATQSSVDFFHNWAKERIDEMDATMASLKSKAAELRAESRVKADHFIADLRKKRDEFEVTVKKQAKAGEAAWETTKTQLETQWKGFEAEVKKYLENLRQGHQATPSCLRKPGDRADERLARCGEPDPGSGSRIRGRASEGHRRDRIAHEG